MWRVLLFRQPSGLPLCTGTFHAGLRYSEVFGRSLDARGVLGTPGDYGSVVNALRSPQVLAFGFGPLKPGELAGLDKNQRFLSWPPARRCVKNET